MRLAKCCKCDFPFYIEKDKKRAWELNRSQCPSCGEPYCSKPPTEKRLFELQDKYFESHKSPQYLNEIIEIMMPYTKHLILQKFNFMGHATDSLEYYVYNTVSFVIEEFLNNAEYKIHSSFAGAILGKVRQALYQKQEKLHTDISIDWEFDDGHTDSNSNLIDKIEHDTDLSQIARFLTDLIIEDTYLCETPYENLIRIVAIWKYLEHGEQAKDKLFRELRYKLDEDNHLVTDRNGNTMVEYVGCFGRQGKTALEETMKLFKQEILKLLDEKGIKLVEE